MSQYLAKTGWKDTSQQDRRKAIHAQIDEIIDELGGIEGMQCVIYGKTGANGFDVGVISRTAGNILALAAMKYEMRKRNIDEAEEE